MTLEPLNWKRWDFSLAEQARFDQWMERIYSVHTGTADLRNTQVNWTPLDRPLSQCVVGLFTTGGVHLNSDKSFDVASPHGDWSFREIPADAGPSDLSITHTHYNHVDADQDINCMFPLQRLRELRDQGVIGGIAPTFFSIMGFNPDPARLVGETAPELARRIKASGADLVFMTCG